MASDNIFSGLKVLDFASFIAGPSAAVILSDFGADVIKVEPPTGDLWRHGHKMPPQPQAEDPYQWHLANRNKRGMTLDLKSPSAQEVLERLVKWANVLIVNTPHPARKKLKLEYDDVAQWNPRLIYADLTGGCDCRRSSRRRLLWSRSEATASDLEIGRASASQNRHQGQECDRIARQTS
jgi:formyl-CoA transferase